MTTSRQNDGSRWLRLGNLALGLWVLVSIAVWYPSKPAWMWVIGLALAVLGLADRGVVVRAAAALLGIALTAWTVGRDHATESMQLVASNVLVAILVIALALLGDRERA